MNAQQCFAKDDQVRKKCGWGGMAFIAPRLPAPRTTVEKAVRELFGDELKDAYLIHVYSVVEIAEQAYAAGRDAALGKSVKKKPAKRRRPNSSEVRLGTVK